MMTPCPLSSPTLREHLQEPLWLWGLLSGEGTGRRPLLPVEKGGFRTSADTPFIFREGGQA